MSLLRNPYINAYDFARLALQSKKACKDLRVALWGSYKTRRDIWRELLVADLASSRPQLVGQGHKMIHQMKQHIYGHEHYEYFEAMEAVGAVFALIVFHCDEFIVLDVNS